MDGVATRVHLNSKRTISAAPRMQSPLPRPDGFNGKHNLRPARRRRSPADRIKLARRNARSFAPWSVGPAPVSSWEMTKRGH